MNVSPDTVADESLVAALASVSLSRLVMEVTEHVGVQDYQAFNQNLEFFRRAGARLAIDDVGAGYSNLRHILEMGPDIIKLDRSLVENINQRRDARALASALIIFAEEMGFKIIAEGIESSREMRSLKKLGVTTIQGYYIGRPEPIGTLLRNPAY